MGRVLRLARSSIGAKAIVAVTGVLLFLYLIAHLLGNLLVFQGRDAINGWAWFLHDHPRFLWTARVVLLAAFLLHVVLVVRLKIGSWAARPQGYRRRATVAATLASRTMIWSGILVFAFIVYHVLHFTLHVVDTGGMETLGDTHRVDVYAMVVTGFRVPWVAISYIVAMLILGYHLWHATRSLFQTLGWNHDAINPAVRVLAPALTLLIVAGNVLIPLVIWLGGLDTP